MQHISYMTDIDEPWKSKAEKILTQKVAVTDTGCFLFTGALSEKGYGRFSIRINGKLRNYKAHRAAWILANGPIPDSSLVLDHLCRTPACVNPKHLELVTSQENLRRGIDPTAKHNPDYCRRGHSRAEHGKKTVTGGRVFWKCRACERLRYASRHLL